MLVRLRQARRAAHLTQVEVAIRLDVPQQLISQIELGERRIDPLELKEFAELYAQPYAYFIDE